LVGNPDRNDHLEDLVVNSGRVIPKWIFKNQDGRSWAKFNWLRARADSRVNKRLGRPRRRWEDYIKMDLQEVGCGGMDWIELAQDRDRYWKMR